jgi:GNAT superfamily N-acetyltransferase
LDEFFMIVIAYLAHHPEVIPTLAEWFHEEWSYLHPERTREDFAHGIQGRANIGSIPLVLVAFKDNEVIGTGCLEVHNLQTYDHLTPWLAGMYVRRDWRGRGVGTQLVAALEAEARNLGVQKLYLFTPNAEAFYLRLGWSVTERTIYKGYEVVIMEKDL